MALACIFIAITCTRDQLSAPGAGDTRPPVVSIELELHVHGWSNHGGSLEPGSIDWHTQQAARAGVDILWWGDHTGAYGAVTDWVITPAGAPTQLSDSLWAIGTWGSADGRALVQSSARQRLQIISSTPRVTLSISPEPNRTLDTVDVLFLGLSGSKVTHPSDPVLSRPLVGDPDFQLSVSRPSANSGFTTEVRFSLAWHPDGAHGYQEALLYRYVGDLVPRTSVVEHTALSEQPWGDADSLALDLRPLTLATQLAGGIDNTIDEVAIRFVVPSASSATFSFSYPRMTSKVKRIDQLMPPAIATAQKAATVYGLRAFWGLETGATHPDLVRSPWFQTLGGGRHLLLLAPQNFTPMEYQSAIAGADTLPEDQIVARLHSRGVIVALAHPFGGSVDVPGPPETHRGQVDSLGQFLAQHRAWGTDMIEVGAKARGGMGPLEHLWLLDELLGAGIKICGVAGTDLHGGELEADPPPGASYNNFVTWIRGVHRFDEENIVDDALRRCDVSFGNPFYARGGLWIDLVDSTGQRALYLDARNINTPAQYFVVEAEIDSTSIGHPPAYRRYRVPAAPGYVPLTDGCRPAFARVEAWSGTKPLAFSNVVSIPGNASRCGSTSLTRF